jgi:hypothetical protein
VKKDWEKVKYNAKPNLIISGNMWKRGCGLFSGFAPSGHFEVEHPTVIQVWTQVGLAF